MKRIVSALALVLFMAGFAMAQDVITFPAKMGNVQFPHKMHQETLKNCKVCHTKAPGKIEGFNKDMAHKLCIDCHKSKGKGPISCKQCHKKS
jgi:predicted CXXCH cytochrome family protein